MPDHRSILDLSSFTQSSMARGWAPRKPEISPRSARSRAPSSVRRMALESSDPRFRNWSPSFDPGGRHGRVRPTACSGLFRFPFMIHRLGARGQSARRFQSFAGISLMHVSSSGPCGREARSWGYFGKPLLGRSIASPAMPHARSRSAGLGRGRYAAVVGFCRLHNASDLVGSAEARLVPALPTTSPRPASRFRAVQSRSPVEAPSSSPRTVPRVLDPHRPSAVQDTPAANAYRAGQRAHRYQPICLAAARAW